jgi:Fe-S-cluster formation regulator IscX/YfhJ
MMTTNPSKTQEWKLIMRDRMRTTNPSTLTFGDLHAREIEDNLTDLDDHSDDSSYQPS